MKKIFGFILIFFGILVIIFSIIILIKAMDLFTGSEASTENFIYTLGTVIFPLLLTVIGRWIYRKGRSLFKTQA